MGIKLPAAHNCAPKLPDWDSISRFFPIEQSLQLHLPVPGYLWMDLSSLCYVCPTVGPGAY